MKQLPLYFLFSLSGNIFKTIGRNICSDYPTKGTVGRRAVGVAAVPVVVFVIGHNVAYNIYTDSSPHEAFAQRFFQIG